MGGGHWSDVTDAIVLDGDIAVDGRVTAKDIWDIRALVCVFKSVVNQMESKYA
jgi:hypothetical protein